MKTPQIAPSATRQPAQTQVRDSAVSAAGEAGFADLRPGVAVQRQLAALAGDSPRGDANARMAAVVGESARVRQHKATVDVIQRGVDAVGKPDATGAMSPRGARYRPVLQAKSRLLDVAASPVSHGGAVVQRVDWTTGAIDGRKTTVDWDTEKVPGVADQVGVKMVATLGPEHQQGGPPKASAQKNLMAKLPTTPSLEADKKYVKGHLLNDNIGGPGEAKNLFPITAKANRQHEQLVESHVKRWVNDEKRWVYYRVEVKNPDYKLAQQRVSAEFSCEAVILDDSLNKTANKVGASIFSEYQTGDAKPYVPTVGTMPKPRPADLAHKPLLSTRSKEKQRQAIRADIRGWCEFIDSSEHATAEFIKKITAYKGIGKATATHITDLKVDTEPTRQQVTAYKRAVAQLKSEDALVDILEEIITEFGLLDEIEDPS